MITRNYYTLKDLLTKGFGKDPEDLYLYLSMGQDMINYFQPLQKLIVYFFGMQAAGGYIDRKPIQTGSKSHTLFQQYFCSRYMEDVIGFIDGDGDIDALYRDWLRKFCNILMRTFEKYDPVIGFYEAQKANLLEQISSTSTRTLNTKHEFDTNDSVTQRFNDTPQNGGDFTDDDYTSTYQKNESVADQETKDTGTVTNVLVTDGETLMSRLDEINDKYENLYARWCDEFESLFIYSAAYED